MDVYNCLEPSNEALIYDFGLKIGDIFVEDFYGIVNDWSTKLKLESIEDDNSYLHSFVSVDESGDILGYICYGVNWTSVSVPSFGAISFVPGGSITYARDLLQCIDNIFMKYNFNRIEWWAAADNPAIRGYKNLCKRFGGREVGYLRQNTKLMDNKLHDSIIFEIMREDYIKSKGRKK